MGVTFVKIILDNSMGKSIKKIPPKWNQPMRDALNDSKTTNRLKLSKRLSQCFNGKQKVKLFKDKRCKLLSIRKLVMGIIS